MPQSDRSSLSDALRAGGHNPERFLWGADASVRLNELLGGSSLGGRLDELRGRSVFLAAKDQLTAGLALIELDRVARRLVLCPPDFPAEHIPSVMTTAAVDAVVSDRIASELGARNIGCFVTCSPRIVPADPRPSGDDQTEWILLTSGTTGMPKLVVHTLSTLAAPIKLGGPAGCPRRLEHFLRHSPLRGASDIPSRGHWRRIDGAVERRGIHRRLPDPSRRVRRDPYLGNPVPLASRADEPVGSQDCSPIRSFVWRDRRPANP